LLIISLLILLLFSITVLNSLPASNNPSTSITSIILEIKADSLRYKLPDNSIVAYSETVTSDNVPLIRDVDYQFYYSDGYIQFNDSSKLNQIISISYYKIPEFLIHKYLLYEKQSIRDSLYAISLALKQPQLFREDSKLMISGSKTFSLTFSNQESYDLKQSLFLSLSGELGNDMKIEGRLSDSQSPLTPEGDSREISSIDQMFMKLYGKHYSVVFGDQEYELTNTDIMKYKIKFEGINLQYFGKYGIQAALAVNNGKQTTNIIQGLEGKQGPYYLKANTTGQTVQVVSGSEKVSVNGNILQRGNDYSIDYTEGSITFKLLITSNSTIIVEFQYSDDYYAQNTYLNSAYADVAPSLRINYNLIKQTDDKDNPLIWSFSQADNDSLQNAGDHDVWGQGAIQVEPGAGQYIKLQDINNNFYYEFSVSDSADYIVYFSYVGYNNGEYEPFAQNKFRYVGIGMGSWMPFKKLIAPTDKTNLGMNVNYRSELLEYLLEGVYTDNDKNTMSTLNDNDNKSMILLSKLSIHPTGFFYNPNLSILFQQKNDNSFTFTNLVPANEIYEFSSIAFSDSLEQKKLELSLSMSNSNYWNGLITARYSETKNILIQRFLKAGTRINQIGYIPSFNWNALFSKQNYFGMQLSDYDIFHQILDNEWKWKFLTLRSRYLLQQNNYSSVSDTASGYRSTKFEQINPGMQISDGKDYSSELSYSYESNANKQSELWKINKKSTTFQFNQMVNKRYNTLNLSYTHRETDDNNSGDIQNMNNNPRYDLLSFNSSSRLWDNSLSLQTLYGLNQLEFYPKVQELQYLGNGLGSYDSTGVQIINGDYDYFYVNSGQSEMSTEITANLSFNFHLSPKYYPGSIIHKFNIDSNFQASENTAQRSDWQLYLLLPSETFNPSTTIYGRRMMQNKLWMDISRSFLTANLNYDISNTIDKRYQTLNKIYSEDTEFVLDWKKFWGGRLETSYLNSVQNESRYNSVIKSNSISAVFYRNINADLNSQGTASYTNEKGDNQNQSEPYTINSFRINPSFIWYPNSKFRVQTEFTTQFNKRTGSEFYAFMPDKRDGMSVLWAFRFFFKMNSFTSGSLEYSGKSYPRENTLHELKMEFRAEL
jgi:hypothetical protein